MIDGIGAAKSDNHIIVERGVFIYVLRILCSPFPVPSPTGDGLRIALLARVVSILVLPPRHVRIAGEKANPQFARIFEGDVRHEVHAQVIIKAAIAHSVEQPKIAGLR
jgi:hypothetical protein